MKRNGRGRMEQIYEIEPLLKAGACIQIYPQGYSMYPFIDPRRDEVVLAGIQDLSIQVHPNDAYAAEHENGSLGKTECWYCTGFIRSDRTDCICWGITRQPSRDPCGGSRSRGK